MSRIRALEPDKNGLGWLEGIFDSVSLFQGEMDIIIYADDDVAKEYAERCVAHYNSLNDNKILLNQLQEYLAKYMLYMYDEWVAMGMDDDIVSKTKVVIDGYKAGNLLIHYLSEPKLCIAPRMEDEIGYMIETECPWEPEHQCLIIIRGDTLKYVGPSEGNTPWDEDEDYYCIWHDENEKKYNFYGWESADIPVLTDEYTGIQNARDLYDALSTIWCADTCAPRMREQWSEDNKTLGQCSITAFFVQDLCGGKVYGVLRPGGNYHCYNEVDGHVFDLTSEQFGDEILSYENNPEQFREIHFSKEEKRLRYEYLKAELQKKYGKAL